MEAKAESADNLLTMDEAIALLNTTRATFYRWVRAGRIKGFKVGRQWRFRREDVEQFLTGSQPLVGSPVSAAPLLARLDEQVAATPGAMETLLPTVAAGDPVLTAFNRLLGLALARQATDIHLEPAERDGQPIGWVRLRCEGALQELCRFDIRLLPALVACFKARSGMDVNETRTQEGRLQVRFGDQLHDLRVCAVACRLGEAVTAHVSTAHQVVMKPAELGLGAADLLRVRTALQRLSGLVLVAGPSGSGKTTALHALAGEVNAPDRKVVSVEGAVEFAIPGVLQLGVEPAKGQTVSIQLRVALRCDPDVLLVTDVPDADVLGLCLQAAATGHLVLANLQALDTAAALCRCRELAGKPLVVADALRLATCQRLVRRLCPDCCRPAKPNAGEAAFVDATSELHGLPRPGPTAEFRVPVGCSKCGRSGFRGRTLIFESLAMSPAIEAALVAGADHDELRRLAIREGMTTMALDGLRKAAAGLTSLREVRRVTP